MKYNIKNILTAFAFLVIAVSCKKQLDIKNPNALPITALTSESDGLVIVIFLYALVIIRCWEMKLVLRLQIN
jgi:hypothetical protein